MQLNVSADVEERETASDKPVVLIALGAIVALALFLRHEFTTRQALLFLIGTGLGITLLHASFGFSSGWRSFVREGRSDAIQAQILLLALSSLAFLPIIGGAFEGLHASPALGPAGVSVIVGAFLFGVGMQLGGGCGSGTLYTVGGGRIRMLITLSFFIMGATLGSAHLHWWLAMPSLGKISLTRILGWPTTLALQLAILAGLFLLVRSIEQWHRGSATRPQAEGRGALIGRLVFGPWPLWWGVVALTSLGALTLIIAGHPWTITFAFGLWGAKIWAAFGGDVANWSYWSTGYPARALSQSVLADTTTIMDFGIILGAVLAASLAGNFAPDSEFRWNHVATAVLGGLLLGYGARLAFGCNIGALLAGIATGSVHGWVWLVFGFLGAMLGIYLRVLFKIDPPVGRPS